MSTNISSTFPYEFLDVYVQAPLCLIGFILNLINFSIFAQKKFSAAPYVLLMAMSLVDSITLIFRISEAVVKCTSLSFCRNPYLQMVMYLFAVFIEVPITNITESISNWTAVALATERYIAMCYYNLSKQYSTVYNAKLFLLFVTLLSIVLNSPFFYINYVVIEWENTTSHQGMVPVIYSSFSSLALSKFYTFHTWFRPFIVKVIPLLFLCVCNFLLLALVWEHKKKLKQFQSKRSGYLNTKDNNKITQRKQRAQNKLTMLLIVVIVLFLIGQIPVSFSYLKVYENLPNRCNAYKYLTDCPNYKVYSSVSHLLMITCYCTNFFVYLALNNHFRNSLMQSVVSCFCHCNRCYRTRILIINENEIALNSILMQSTAFLPANRSSTLSSNSPMLSVKDNIISQNSLHPNACLRTSENTIETYLCSRSSSFLD